MNVNTGKLYRLQDEITLEEMRKAFGEAMQPVPEELVDEANQTLGEHEYVQTDLKSKSPLALWAKSERKKIKNKKKMAKKSRKANRK